MKKLFLSLIAVVLFSGFSWGQDKSEDSNEKKVKLFCVTTSCCSIGIITVEVWSQTTCHYVYSQKKEDGNSYSYSVEFKTEKPILEKYIDINEDVLLAGIYGENGEYLVLPKGRHFIEKNVLFFNPKLISPSEKAIRVVCYERVVDGSVLGHHYHYSWGFCIFVNSNRQNNQNTGNLVINPKIEASRLSKMNNGELSNIITVDKDVQIIEKDINFTLKAGDYYVNEDGMIYLQSAKIK